MTKQSKREARRARKAKARTRSYFIWGGMALASVVLVAGLWVVRGSGSKTDGDGSAEPVGTAVAILPADHVQPGTDPGPYNSDPPTSGRHYAAEFDAGFYDEGSPQAAEPHPEAYLVHNLEHGYVIFWYNCALLDNAGCTTLKDKIKQVMSEFDNFKLIAFPRPSLDVPLAMTSWGRLQLFESFDSASAGAFIRGNRNKAPEPNAP